YLVGIADATTRVNAIPHHHRAGVDVEAREVPHLLAFHRIDAVQPVIAGAAVDPAIDYARCGFRVAAGGEFPDLLTLLGVQAEHPALEILMKALANVEAIAHNHR